MPPRTLVATSAPASSTIGIDEVASSNRLWQWCPRLIHRAVVDSTNSYLFRLLRNDPAIETWTTVVADHQSAGRGRYTRSWVDTPQTALLFSTVVRAATEQLGWVSLLAGIAMARVLRVHKASVKWPNDVIVDGKKVAGILTEHISHENDEHTVVLGVGLNIGTVPAQVGLNAGAIKVQQSTQTRDHLLTAFLSTYRSLLDQADLDTNPVPTTWVEEYTELLIGLGQETTIHLASGETITATVHGIDHDGALIVRHGDAPLTITCGDVALASPDNASTAGGECARERKDGTHDEA
ncbi:MAG: biotin--[acetyl-CoA-carboxylase] ligase [Actinomycetaceae bacterium]|nr:biotin--[acetyl-CoA-carboxylase] ligase [Actinomycetaceae bacterium]